MKKIIESDLIAIAHKILKMKDKSDVNALHTETQKLYEKLSVLKFYEENLNRFDQAPAPEKIEELLNDNNVDNTPKHNSNPMMPEEIIEELLEETQVASRAILPYHIVVPSFSFVTVRLSLKSTMGPKQGNQRGHYMLKDL